MLSRQAFQKRNRRYGQRRVARILDDPVLQEMKTLVNTVKDLTLVTQNKFLPGKRDVQMFRTPARPPIHTFRKVVSKPNVTANQFESVGAISFALSDLANYTELTALYDQYRIMEVRVQFAPLAASFGESTSSSAYPTVFTVIDMDDDALPASIDVLKQYDTCQVTPNGSAFERIIHPRSALAAYSGTFTSYAQSPYGQWLDIASPGILYYGLKWGASPVTTASGSFQLYSITCTYTVQCKSTR